MSLYIQGIWSNYFASLCIYVSMYPGHLVQLLCFSMHSCLYISRASGPTTLLLYAFMSLCIQGIWSNYYASLCIHVSIYPGHLVQLLCFSMYSCLYISRASGPTTLLLFVFMPLYIQGLWSNYFASLCIHVSISFPTQSQSGKFN